MLRMSGIFSSLTNYMGIQLVNFIPLRVDVLRFLTIVFLPTGYGMKNQIFLRVDSLENKRFLIPIQLTGEVKKKINFKL